MQPLYYEEQRPLAVLEEYLSKRDYWECSSSRVAAKSVRLKIAEIDLRAKVLDISEWPWVFKLQFYDIPAVVVKSIRGKSGQQNASLDHIAFFWF